MVPGGAAKPEIGNVHAFTTGAPWHTLHRFRRTRRSTRKCSCHRSCHHAAIARFTRTYIMGAFGFIGGWRVHPKDHGGIRATVGGRDQFASAPSCAFELSGNGQRKNWASSAQSKDSCRMAKKKPMRISIFLRSGPGIRDLCLDQMRFSSSLHTRAGSTVRGFTALLEHFVRMAGITLHLLDCGEAAFGGKNDSNFRPRDNPLSLPLSVVLPHSLSILSPFPILLLPLPHFSPSPFS